MNTIVLVLLGFGIGTILGSFVKATSERVINQQSIWGRSYCTSCKKNLRWYDLFPILSYLFLVGKCRYCKKPIPKELIYTELGMGLIVGLLFYLFAFSLLEIAEQGFDVSSIVVLSSVIFQLFIICVLAIVFLVDLKTGYIYDKITFPGVAIASFYLVLITGFTSWVFYQGLAQDTVGQYLLPPHSDYFYFHLQQMWINVGISFASGIIASLIFVLLIVATAGRGMGWGDVKFVLFIGIALGFPKIIVGLFAAFLLGAGVSMLLVALGKKKFRQTVPFGPFLSVGALIALFWGNQIYNWYINGFVF